MKTYFGSHPPGSHLIKQAYDDLFSSPPGIVALDVETVSLKDRRVLGIGIATPANDSFFFDIFDTGMPWHLIQPSPTKKVWHNAPFDLSWEVLGKFGADIENIEDSIILTRMMPAIPNELRYASQFVQTQTEDMGDVLARGGVTRVIDLPWLVVAEKCCRDALATMQVFLKLRPQVSTEYYETERKFLVKLMKMSHKGIKLDKLRVEEIDRELEANLTIFMGTAQSLGFNPRSPEQVAIVMNSLGYILPTNKDTGRPMTGEETLEHIPEPEAQLTILARKYSKLHGTYVHKWLKKDRAFTQFKTDAVTGRTTSSGENLQNIPTGQRRGDIVPEAGSIRSCFIPDTPEGTKWDCSQIEYRVLAYLSQDKEMMAIFDDPLRNIHRETQHALKLTSYIDSKTFGFAMVYGGDNAVISKNTGIQDLARIEEFKRGWRLKFPQAWDWIVTQQAEGLRTLRVRTMFGRELNLTDTPQAMSEKHLRNCAVNWPIQGTAAELFKRVINALDTVIPIGDLLSQTHDDSWTNGVHEIPKEVEHLSPLWTPIEVEHVRRFG